MRDFGKVSPAFWTGYTGRQIRSLGHECQIVALYLLTAPGSTMSGVYYMPVSTLSHETGVPLEGAYKALRSLRELEFAEYYEPLEVVWVIEMARHQIGETCSTKDLRHKGLIRELKAHSRCPLLLEFWDKYADTFSLPGECPYKPLPSPYQAPTKPLPSPYGAREVETEMEKETEIETEKETGAVAVQSVLSIVDAKPTGVRKRDRALSDIQAIFAVWAENRRAKHPRGTEPRLDDDRSKHIRERLLDGFDVETLKLAAEGVWRCSWNLGENDRQTEYCDIRHAMGDAKKVEKFSELARKFHALGQSTESGAHEVVAPDESTDRLPEVG